MAYKQKVYIKAQNILQQRRSSAVKQQQANRRRALELCPQIAKIDSEIASYAAQAVKMIGLHKGGKEKIDELAAKSLEAQQKRRNELVQAGLSYDFLELHHFCPKCHDTGSHDGYFCDCYINLLKNLAREEIAPLKLLDQSSFENFTLDYYSDDYDEDFGISPREHMKSVLFEAKSFAENFPKVGGGLLMFGSTGLGKTHLCLAIADYVTKKGYNVCYCSAQNAMNKLEKEHFGRSSDSDTLSEIISSDLLLLDDLGAEFITSFSVSQIYNIINTRLIEGKPSVMSTNLMPEEIEEKYSQRVVSRIIGSLTPMRFLGADIRQIKAMS